MHSIPKILFCFYPLVVSWSHGIALLSSVCKTAGIGVDLCIIRDLPSFRRKVLDYKPDVIGFSFVTIHDYRFCLEYIVEAKRFGVPVLAGGHYARMGGEITGCVDAVCRGYGMDLPETVKNGRPYLFPGPDQAPDFNALPLADYDLFDGISFERDVYALAGKRLLPYVSSLGCPFRCNFCDTREQDFRLRLRDQEDLSYLTDRFKPDVIYFNDATLPYFSKNWQASWGEFRYPFFAMIRPDIMEPDLLWLIDRGLVACAMGIESGSEQFRNDVLGKHILDDEIYETVETLKKHGIPYATFWISHYPGEKFQDLMATERMIERLGGYPSVFLWDQQPRRRAA